MINNLLFFYLKKPIQMFMNQMVLIPQPWAQNQMSHNQIAVMPQVDQQMEVRTVIQGERYTDLIKIGINDRFCVMKSYKLFSVWQREFNRLFAQESIQDS